MLRIKRVLGLFCLLCLLLSNIQPTSAGIVQCFSSSQVCFQAAGSSNPNSVDIFLATKIQAGWISIGFGPGMNKVDMIMLFRPSPDAPWTVSRRLSTGYSRPPAAPEQNVEIQKFTTTPDAEGYFQILLSRPVSKGSGEIEKSIVNESMQMAVASYEGSGASPTSFPIHTNAQQFLYTDALNTGTPVAYGQLISQTGKSAGNSRYTAILIHAICMALAWTVLSFISVLFARYMKGMYTKQWFPIHRALAFLVLLLTTVGFALAVATNSDSYFKSLHGKIGLVVFLACIGQVGLGMYINTMFDPLRSSIPLHDKLHWIFGYFVVIVAPVNVILGHFAFGSSMIVMIMNLVVIGIFIAVFIWGQVAIGQVHETDSTAKLDEYTM